MPGGSGSFFGGGGGCGIVVGPASSFELVGGAVFDAPAVIP
jgi:hypothetical protein